jgi:ADP-ribose pyrophosphatase YjhB (NUDIX family)
MPESSSGGQRIALREATLCLLIQEGVPAKVLLGYKKIGFGQGKYTGFGGKVEQGESVRAAALREMREESGLQVCEQDVERVGHLTFLFPSRPDWSQVVHVFLGKSWKGELTESDEMKPALFQVDDLPFESMWQDAVYWLPPILEGKRIQARFVFRSDNESIAEMMVQDMESGTDYEQKV